MGLSDRLKQLTETAEKTAAEHKDQIKQAVEKAEVTADQRSGGRYHDQIAGAAAKARSYVDRLERDPIVAPPSPAAEPPAAEPPAAEPPAGAAG